MNTNDENEEEAETKMEEPMAKKQRRSKEKDSEGILDFGPEISAIPLSPIHPQEQDKEKKDGEGGEVVIKDRYMAQRNFNVRTSKMGIVREAMNPQILEEKQGQLQFKDLIDPTMVAIIDNAREIGMNFLNNARNNMIDNFRSIKWLYHELEEFKEKIS